MAGSAPRKMSTTKAVDPTDGRRIVRFRMTSRRQSVAPMVERVLAAVDPVGLEPAQRENLAVAVAEALANAAVHGNNLRATASVRVAIEIEPGQAVIDVRDSGEGFDVGGLNDPTEPAHVLATGGRGVFLMRRLVDDVSFNETGNGVRLTVRTVPRVAPG